MKIGTPPDGALPLVIAPFATMHLAASPDGSVSDISDELVALSSRLARMADAERADIDPRRGVFRFLPFERERQAFQAWLSVAPYADEEEIDRALSSLDAGRATIFREAIRAIWGAICHNLSMLIRANAYSIIAQVRTPLAEEFTEIPTRSWNYFKIEDWRAGICLCSSSGDRLYDVHLRRNAYAQMPSRATAKGKTGCKAWLASLRNDGPSQKTKAAYFEEASEEFGVTPYQFEDVWAEVATGWSKPGVRRKRKA